MVVVVVAASQWCGMQLSLSGKLQVHQGIVSTTMRNWKNEFGELYPLPGSLALAGRRRVGRLSFMELRFRKGASTSMMFAPKQALRGLNND